MGAGLTVQVLGPVEARGPAGPVAVSGVKLQVLLALLALHAPHGVSADRLIDEMWGEDLPTNPANSLQAQVSQLRRLLGRDAVVRRGTGYALAVEADGVDAVRFADLVVAGRAAVAGGDPRGGAQLLRSALALVRGPVLADLRDREGVRGAAAGLEEDVLAVHEALGDAELAAGRHAEVVGALAELVRTHPLRERFAAQLITALYRCGRQVDALQAYAQVREALIEEFGVEPGTELRDLEAKVLAHDPSLDAPPAMTAPPVTAPPVAAGPVATAAPAPASGAAAPTAPIPHGSAFHRTPGRLPLVGRAAELALTRSDLADVVDGRGRAIVLVGEPGIGKTRVAEEVAEDAEQAGATIGWGRSHDGWGEVAFRTWAQVLSTLVERVPADVLAAALGRGAAVLAQIAPELLDVVGEVEPPSPLDPDASRARVCEALTTTLRALARDRPVVVVLDDIQWADAASLQALGHLAREITDARILVVVTYRSVGAPDLPHLVDALSVLVRQPIVRRIELTGLDRDGLAALVAATGTSPDDDLLTTVHRRTQGNPFFAVEVLRLLPAGDAGPIPVGGVGSAIPSGVRDVVRQRISTLPDETAAIVAAVAVLDGAPRVSTLALVADLDVVTLLDRLEPALTSGVVVASDDLGRVRLSHGLVGETVQADLRVAARARLNLRCAEALGTQHGDADGPHLVDAAHHWARAMPLAPTRKAVAAALRAAAWAEAHLAHEQAEDLLRSAADLVGALPAGADRDELELAVLDRLSLVQIVTIGYGSEEVVRACLRMRELCQAIDDRTLLRPALWRLAIYFCIAMELDTAQGLAEQLLALGEGEDRAAALLGHMAMGTILTHRGDIAPARPHLDQAQELLAAGACTALGDVVAETPTVWCGVFSAWNRWLLGDEAGAEDEVVATVAAADVQGVPYGQVFAVWFSVLVATLRGDAAAVLARCERGIPEAATGGFGMFVPYMVVSRGWAVAARGDVELGCDELLGAAGAIKASGARMMVPVFPAFLATVCLDAGSPDRAVAACDEGLAAQDATGERWYSAELHRLRGAALAARDPDDPAAVAAVRQAVAVADAQGAAGLRARAEATLAGLRG